MLTVAIEVLLDDFVACSDAIQDVVMISAQGQPLTCPYSISPNSAHTLADRMLHLATCISDLWQWHIIDWVIVQAQEGYLILAQCSLEAFLLIKATVAPTGYLKNYIQGHLDRFQAALQFPSQDYTLTQSNVLPQELTNDIEFSSNPNIPIENSQDSPTLIQSANPTFPLYLDEFEITYCQQELTERVGPIASLICERVLQQNPNLRLDEFINALSQQIPDQRAALEFQKKLLSNSN